MEIDKKAMMTEMGGAFAVAWVGVLTMMGMSSMALTGAVMLAVVWMAFSGAHVLPMVTWCNIMTGDLADAEGNWMANGMRMLAQVVGAVLAILLATEFGEIDTTWAATDMWIPDIADHIWGVVGMIAAGAIWWQVHTRCDSAWASAFGLMMLAGAMTLTGANEMGASITSAGDGIVDTLVNWIVDGAIVGVGALLGTKIDELV
ncbi:MAG: hypothetical protein QGF94_05425 [Candidatus Thalassarchaeaceae archaeon]|jgi:hypothetical protein|nr:hypothetical protein [Candidatus Thalassarchaeaceae archaeon]